MTRPAGMARSRPREAVNEAASPGRRGAVEAAVSGRYSCRAYLDKPVPREVISRILEIAQRSASWCNSQPWQVYVTGGPGIERLRTALFDAASSTHAAEFAPPDLPAPDRYDGIYAVRRRECGLQLYESIGVVRGDRAASAQAALRNFAFFGAPHAAIITTPRSLGVYGAVDCGGFVSTFMLVARVNGVASIALGSIARYSSLVRTLLGISADECVMCAIAFGYEDATHPVNRFRTRRATAVDAVKWMDD